MTIRHDARGSMVALGFLLLVGCSTTKEGAQPAVGDGTSGADEDAGIDGGADAGEPDAGGGEGEQEVPCATAAARGEAALETHCAPCHTGLGAKGGFSTVLDPRELVASGRVLPDDAEGSLLYQRMASGEMPPAEVTKRPSAEEISAVQDWIRCGFPTWDAHQLPPVPSIETRLKVLIDDLRTFPDEERADIRYIDLSHLGAFGSRHTRYIEALGYLLNSLSKAPELAVPARVDEAGLLLRIRLSAYGFTAETWERIVAAYPYAVAYDRESLRFPHDDGDGADLRAGTGTEIPVVFGDWLLAHVARPPLYYEVLGAPATLAGLETELGIDISDGIANHSAQRAGVTVSALSRFNRVIERHPLDQAGRGLWMTYDFDASVDTSDIFAHPLDFAATSSELFYELPNGLQAFMIVDGRGARLDRAPSGSVQDDDADDLAIEVGISCLNCHVEKGLFRVEDEIRERSTTADFSEEDEDEIAALYPRSDELDAWFQADATRFRTAMRTAALDEMRVGATRALEDEYAADLSFGEVAALLGVDQEALRAAVTPLRSQLPGRLVTAASDASTELGRASFEDQFDEIVTALGLGTALRP